MALLEEKIERSHEAEEIQGKDGLHNRTFFIYMFIHMKKWYQLVLLNDYKNLHGWIRAGLHVRRRRLLWIHGKTII